MATTTKVLLKFADDDNYYRCEVQRMSEHMIKVIGLIQDLSGFQIFSNAYTMIGDYSDYTYEYTNPNLDANTYEYTNNNAEYPDEGSDKSTKQQLKEELSVYVNELTTAASTVINNTISTIQTNIDTTNESTTTQLNEIQNLLVELSESLTSLI